MATAVLNKNGKRQRGDMESDDAEFVPLSKRINNLHLQPVDQRLLAGHHLNHHHGHHPTFQPELNHHNGHFNRTESCSAEGALWQQNGHQHHNGQNYHHRSAESQQASHARHPGGSNGFPSEDSNSSEAYSRGLPSPQHEMHNGVYTSVPSPMSNFPEHLLNQQSSNYSPVLSPEANPHYYEPNKQLYNLYLERMNRQGKQLHPHFQEHY